ncbi:hypothetical protein [Streptomyces cylindrosporus]|uniref:Uncharacterized protein n=1 Tax=Streptomyces cylindrosporus TaxID=2927583 RepID=A0ABS9YK88_9ACTN|nr:hypothetical protein [Streptomyces cylindrosporus]MCI3277599.1 hypothetical protein [Streptomyces cylindrosporus]
MSDQTPSPSAAVKAVLYDAITEAVADLRKNAGAAAQTEGLKNLAEAYAWLTYPNQQHG